VANAATSGHDLYLSWSQHLTVAKAIFMLKSALYDDRDDLHVAVAVHAKSLAGFDDVIVNDAKRAKAHVARVVVFTE
jgi:hypothetical protein